MEENGDPDTVPERHDDTRARAHRILRDAYQLPLSEVVDPRMAAPTPASAASWGIPDNGRSALIRWGLPAQIKTDFFENFPQQDQQPELSRDGSCLYLLGRLNRFHIGAEAGTGAIYGLLCKSGSTRYLLNSSIEHYIECAWRWYAALPTLIELVYWAWEPNQLDFCDEKQIEVSRAIAAIDPEAAAGENTIWQGLSDL